MRKTILMFLLAFVSGSALAAWARVGGTEDFGAYADLATIHRTGSKVKMWQLLDYKAVQSMSGSSYLSVKSQYEFDCKEYQFRELYLSLYSEKMGGGEVVVSGSGAIQWLPVPPETIIKVLWQSACKKK